MKIKVTSTSFSQNTVLKNKLKEFFPDSTFNEAAKKFSRAELLEYLADADGAIIGLEAIDVDLVTKLPNLKIVSKYGVGLDNIDVDGLKSKNVAVGWTGGINKRSVSELALSFLLGLSRNVFFTGTHLKAGRWVKDGGMQLSGKTVGIIGCGHIGTDLLKFLQPFGCEVLICDILDKSDIAKQFGARQVSQEDVLKKSDFVSLHVPLTAKTKNLADENFFKQMKPTAYFINTSRGPIVDESVLKSVLKNKKIAGAAIDVFLEEPPTDLEFLSLPNLFATPHIGGNAIEAVMAMGESAISHLVTFFGKTK